MPPRNSARSSAARSQASSPPKASRLSESPVGRRTRSSRSRSLDPDVIAAAMRKQRGSKRAQRETSVSSAGSATSASSRVSRARKNIRKPAENRDLSVVAEDIEDNEEARGLAPSDEDVEDEDHDVIGNIATENPGSRSPALSQYSGTTAISTYSAQEIAKLDPIMAEFLPDLLVGAFKILDHLAPKDAIETEDQVALIVNDLKIPGSQFGKRLRRHEEIFTPAKHWYGSDIYIQLPFVLRKLLGTKNPEEGIFRPDPIIHAANLATLVTEFLVLQRGEAKTQTTLQAICLKEFPHSFIGKADVARLGQQSEDEIFELSLDFHTQTAMVCLTFLEEEGNQFTPSQVLASIFFDQYNDENPEASFTEMTEEGVMKDILRLGQPYRKAQVEMINERLALIDGTFRYSEEAREAGDLVDFDQLEELFPWMKFITHLVQWSRSRFDDIIETIRKRGGIDEITKSLIVLVKAADSQVDLRYDPPPAAFERPELLPTPQIGNKNKSFDSAADIQTLLRMKGKTGKSPASHFPANSLASSSKPPQARSKQASSAPMPVSAQIDPEPTQEAEDEDQPMTEDRNDDTEERQRPISEYTAAWNENSKEKNKENHKPTAKVAKSRLIDRQANAQKIAWNESQDGIAAPSPKKRPLVEEESEESDDHGFQEDQRAVDISRRVIAPPGPSHARNRSGTLPPSKKQRREQVEASPRVESSRAAAQRGPEQSQLERARREPVDESDSDSDSDMAEGHPPPTATQVSVASRIATARSRGVQAPRGRIPWSDRDSRILTRRIEKHGCAWATIFNLGRWDVTRDQVAIKDRARNMKVNHLKSGIPLPLNFDLVPLGKKEIAAVRTRIPDYEE
ncbi:hypothetical protein WAI453_007786 [Rhynchosporium graminicola]|uniref:Myb-like domain-containing protein n=1 Tax=Rhynchosporium graminicola TaxID=2792576 RepID=A0A1E1L2C8_9HELO|nr:uncharacterized protein RCO7_05503 [Rhynchosporium commune]